jgi:hypothetical protein
VLGTAPNDLGPCIPELHNVGIDLLADSSIVSRDRLMELNRPLHDELVHANALYRKRFLGPF